MTIASPVKPLVLSLAIAFTAAACNSGPAPAPAAQDIVTQAEPPPLPDVTPQQQELAVRQYAELQQMAALDDRCQWLDPAARAALDSATGERAAWLVWQQQDMEQAQAAAREKIAVDKTDCGNEEIMDAVRHGTWQMRVTWALRAHALLTGGDRPAWLAGLSTVESHRDSLETAVATLKTRHGSSIEHAQPAIARESQTMLAVRCAGKAGCPATHGEPWATYAEAWLTQAEHYADALEAVDDKTGTMPGWVEKDASP